MSGHPVATSTPRGEDQLNTSGEGTERDINTRPSSASSDLTQISTTDISSHGDRDDDEDERDITPRNVTNTSHQKYTSSTAHSSGSGQSELRELTAKLSDVEVSLEGGVNVTHFRSSSDSPPPLPLSPPPTLDDTGNVNGERNGFWDVLLILSVQRKYLSHQRNDSQLLLKGQWH